MIRSMTGFARSETRWSRGVLVWELRSVNHRYLEAQVRLPEGLRAIEPEARQVIAGGVRRGKIDAALSMRLTADRKLHASLNEELARELVTHAQTLAAAIGKAAAINPVDLLRWPGVLHEEESGFDSAGPFALEGLRQAVGDLAASREREGARTRELLETRCGEIFNRVAAVRAHLPQVLSAIRDKLGERVRSLAVTVDAERLEQEIVLIAQKLDVSEELDRLDGHVAEFRAAMGRRNEATGRRLDFLLQEFNREANTLASKSADAETTRQAVDLKVLIEQMREQVQNVE